MTKKKARKIRVCALHGCRKRKTTKCPYCNDFFCEEHINPYKPEYGRDFNKEVVQGHPCVEYQQHEHYLKLSKKIIDDAKMQCLISSGDSIEKWIECYLKKYSDSEREIIERNLFNLYGDSLKKCKIYNCKKLATKKCLYCNNYFCEEHIDPFESIQYRDNYDARFLSKIKQDLKGKTHPCIPYTHENVGTVWSTPPNDFSKEVDDENKNYEKQQDKVSSIFSFIIKNKFYIILIAAFILLLLLVFFVLL